MSDTHTFLATEGASRRQIRIAQIAVFISALGFAVAVPFAQVQLGPVAAFVPTYVATLVICDAITAVLLFNQFNFLKSRALLVLACAYAFTAAMTTSYVLMFPGLFSPAGLLGAGPQSTSAMYIFWHAGFPLLVLVYARLKRPVLSEPGRMLSDDGAPRTILLSVAVVVAIVVAYTALATAGRDYLPHFIDGNRTSDLGHIVLAGDWLLAFLALMVLLWRRPHTVLDLWLMVVMCVWLFDLGLAAILNTGRYDFGWYAGRIYGLLAASVLLVMLLIENASHYARLVRMSAKLSETNTMLEVLAQRDPLTNLANRRMFDTYLTTQTAIARRHGRTLALILFDIDGFKAYNDHYGHQAGDACLKQVAATLQSCCRRPADVAARYGGEEFAIILPDTDLAGASVTAESARSAVERLRIPHGPHVPGGYITISAGVAVLVGGGGSTGELLIADADRALFQAKELGRNRVVPAGYEPVAAMGRARGASSTGRDIEAV